MLTLLASEGSTYQPLFVLGRCNFVCPVFILYHLKTKPEPSAALKLVAFAQGKNYKEKCTKSYNPNAQQGLAKSICNLYSPVATVAISPSIKDSLYGPIHCAAEALALKNLSVTKKKILELLKKSKQTSHKHIQKTNGWRNCTD